MLLIARPSSINRWHEYRLISLFFFVQMFNSVRTVKCTMKLVTHQLSPVLPTSMKSWVRFVLIGSLFYALSTSTSSGIRSVLSISHWNIFRIHCMNSGIRSVLSIVHSNIFRIHCRIPCTADFWANQTLDSRGLGSVSSYQQHALVFKYRSSTFSVIKREHWHAT